MYDNNKDYILNLRVSKQTYEKIKGRAVKNGSSISTLLRGIISDSVEIISDLSSDLRGKTSASKFNDVASYHKGILAKDRACDNCKVNMNKGQVVTIGETDEGAAYFFCAECK
jgi:hypothetical protein